MVLVTTALENFINDFELENINEQVCFDAVINIMCDNEQVQLQNKVVIVNASLINLDTIYLLNNQLAAFDFPELFRSDRNQFSYSFRKYLKIKGTTSTGNPYLVTIQPKPFGCKAD